MSHGARLPVPPDPLAPPAAVPPLDPAAPPAPLAPPEPLAPLAPAAAPPDAVVPPELLEPPAPETAAEPLAPPAALTVPAPDTPLDPAAPPETAEPPASGAPPEATLLLSSESLEHDGRIVVSAATASVTGAALMGTQLPERTPRAERRSEQVLESKPSRSTGSSTGTRHCQRRVDGPIGDAAPRAHPYCVFVVMTAEPPVSDPEVAFNVIFPALVVDWTMASTLPLNAERDLPL